MNASITIDQKVGTATIIVPLRQLTPSSSGKTLLFINQNGNNAVKGVYDGKPCTVTITGYIKA
jgi:hypothetical protein